MDGSAHSVSFTVADQPTQLEWIANVKIAKALGITIPQTIMVQAKRVIR